MTMNTRDTGIFVEQNAVLSGTVHLVTYKLQQAPFVKQNKGIKREKEEEASTKLLILIG